MRTFRIKAINNIPKKERRTNTLKLTKGENYQLCVGRQIRDVVNYFKPKAPYKKNKRKGRR